MNNFQAFGKTQQRAIDLLNFSSSGGFSTIDVNALTSDVKDAGYRFAEGQPKLIPDPVLTLTNHFGSSPSLALNVPGLPCTVNAWIIISHLTMRAIPKLWPSDRMDPPTFARFLDSAGQGDFPIHMAHYGPNPEDTTYVLVSGSTRADNISLVFAPRRMPAPIPGNPPPPAIPAHWAVVQMRPKPPAQRPPYVYFGNVFLSANIYWHATRPSPEYNVMARNRMACLCQTRCSHEPVEVRGHPSFGFLDTRDRQSEDHYLADVFEIYLPQYSHGPDSSLCYLTLGGKLVKQKDAFGLEDRADLRTSESETLVLTSMSLRLYKPRLELGLWQKTQMAIVSTLVGPSLAYIMKDIYELHFSPLFKGPLVPALPIALTISALAYCGYKRFHGVVQRFRIFQQNSNYRGAIPPTMRLGATGVGRKLTSVVGARTNWTSADLKALVRKTVAENHYRDDLNPLA